MARAIILFFGDGRFTLPKTTVAMEHGWTWMFWSCGRWWGWCNICFQIQKRQLTEAQQRAEPCFDTVFLHQLLRCVTKTNWRNGVSTVVAARGVRHVYWLSDVRAVCDLCPGPLCDDAVQKAELRRWSDPSSSMDWGIGYPTEPEGWTRIPDYAVVTENIGGGNSNIFDFHLYLGKWSIWGRPSKIPKDQGNFLFGWICLVGDFLRIVTLWVNHHFSSPPFGRICFGTFSEHRTCKSKLKVGYRIWDPNADLQLTQGLGEKIREFVGPPYGCFLKWWYPQHTPKWSFLVGNPHGCWVPPF